MGRNERADRAFAVYQAVLAARRAFNAGVDARVDCGELIFALNQAERRAWNVVQQVWEQEGLNGQEYVEVVA